MKIRLKTFIPLILSVRLLSQVVDFFDCMILVHLCIFLGCYIVILQISLYVSQSLIQQSKRVKEHGPQLTRVVEYWRAWLHFQISHPDWPHPVCQILDSSPTVLCSVMIRKLSQLFFNCHNDNSYLTHNIPIRYLCTGSSKLDWLSFRDWQLTLVLLHNYSRLVVPML